MRKILLLIIVLTPLMLEAQTHNVRSVVDGNNIIFYRGQTELNPNAAGEFNVLNYGAVVGDDLCDASAIQAAVDLASSYDWGIVKIPSGAYDIADSITLKSGVVIDIDPNAFFTIEADYAGPVFTTYGARVQDAWVKGGYFYGTTKTWNFVNIYGNDSYETVINHFVDNKIYNAKDVINVDIKGTTGWVNANEFRNMAIWNPVSFLKVRDAEAGSLGFDGNHFHNIIIQTHADTKHVIDSLPGDNNIFTNIYMWDLDPGQMCISFTSYASGNFFTGSFTSTPDDYIEYNDASKNKIINRGQEMPYVAHLTYVSASSGLTSGYQGDVVYFDDDSNIDITADPQIASGPFNGYIMTIVCVAASNTLTLDDGTGLNLSAQWVGATGDAITLMWVDPLSVWVELSRSNN